MIGLHPTSANGVLGLKNKNGGYIMIELVSRPRSIDQDGKRIVA
jgi:hypothetical protein